MGPAFAGTTGVPQSNVDAGTLAPATTLGRLT
jgi:hypothetical protein